MYGLVIWPTDNNNDKCIFNQEVLRIIAKSYMMSKGINILPPRYSTIFV